MNDQDESDLQDQLLNAMLGGQDDFDNSSWFLNPDGNVPAESTEGLMPAGAPAETAEDAAAALRDYEEDLEFRNFDAQPASAFDEEAGDVLYTDPTHSSGPQVDVTIYADVDPENLTQAPSVESVASPTIQNKRKGKRGVKRARDDVEIDYDDDEVEPVKKRKKALPKGKKTPIVHETNKDSNNDKVKSTELVKKPKALPAEGPKAEIMRSLKRCNHGPLKRRLKMYGLKYRDADGFDLQRDECIRIAANFELEHGIATTMWLDTLTQWLLDRLHARQQRRAEHENVPWDHLDNYDPTLNQIVGEEVSEDEMNNFEDTARDPTILKAIILDEYPNRYIARDPDLKDLQRVARRAMVHNLEKQDIDVTGRDTLLDVISKYHTAGDLGWHKREGTSACHHRKLKADGTHKDRLMRLFGYEFKRLLSFDKNFLEEVLLSGQNILDSFEEQEESQAVDSETNDELQTIESTEDESSNGDGESDRSTIETGDENLDGDGEDVGSHPASPESGDDVSEHSEEE